MHNVRREDNEAEARWREASALRRAVVETLHRAGGGHFGGALSALDILLTLYRDIVRIRPDTCCDSLRDRVVLSKGHAAVALYIVLAHLGFFPRAWLAGYGEAGSPLAGHPDMTLLPGVDFSTGSLGQGLAAGLGMALALRRVGAHVWVILGDGECQEGQVWEASLLAAHYGVSNLHAVIDANGFQECGRSGCNSPTPAPPVPSLAAKWRAFGWQVFELDGHDGVALERAFRHCQTIRHLPSVVVAETIKGYGFRDIESDPVRFHCTMLADHELSTVLASERVP